MRTHDAAAVVLGLVLAGLAVHAAFRLLCCVRRGESAWSWHRRLGMLLGGSILFALSLFCYLPDDPYYPAVHSCWQYGPARQTLGVCGMMSAAVQSLCAALDGVLSAYRTKGRP